MWLINLILAGLRAWEEAERKAREQAMANLPPQARAQVEAQIARSAQLREQVSPRLAQAAQAAEAAVRGGATTPRTRGHADAPLLPRVHAAPLPDLVRTWEQSKTVLVDDAPGGISEWVLRLFEGRRN